MIAFDAAAVTVPAPAEATARQRGAVAPDTVIIAPTTLLLADRRVAVIGANGSGKSTLARMINGLTLPTTGAVTVAGLDTRSQGEQVRQKVGFIFADADAQVIMPTPLEDVMLSLRRSDLSARQRSARALDVLGRFGLADLASVPVQALSGGQKQLLAIAGVLVTEPDVLVCDEPTTRLDLRWRLAVDRLLAGLPQQVILVTHDLGVAAEFDRCLVVDHGVVIHDSSGSASVGAYRELAAAHPLPERA